MTRDFDDTYGRLYAPVRAKCRRILGVGAAADDVAQETFVRLWRSGPDPGADVRTLMAWLYLTSTRLSLDVLRQGRRHVDSAVEPMSCASSPAEVAAARSAIAALTKTVTADALEAALLARVDGLSQSETAFVLGVSERTVRRLLERFDAASAELREETQR